MNFRLPVVPNSFPDRIAVHCLIEGVDAPKLPGAHVLELACGQGENLIPSAYWLRDTFFWGFDSSSKKIAIAKKDANLLNIVNASFTTEEASLKKAFFDYILIPNVFSHTSNEVRKRIANLACRLLKPNGMVFLRYQPNAALLRRAYLYKTLQPVLEKAMTKTEASKSLFELTRELAFLKPHSIRQQESQTECKILNSYGPEGIAFQIESGNLSPLLPSEARKQFQALGLTLVREMNNCGLESHRQVSAIKKFVADRLDGAIDSDDLIDFYTCEEYREEIYCFSSHLQTCALSVYDVVGRLIAQMAISTARPDIHLDEGVEVGFITNTGAVVRSKKKIEKAILKQFVFTRGKAASLEALIDKGFVDVEESKEDNIVSVFTSLLDLMDKGILRLRTNLPLPREHLSPISPLAQWQNEKGPALSTNYHDLLIIDDLTRAVIFKLSEGISVDQITNHIEILVNKGELIFGDDAANKSETEKRKLVKEITQEAVGTLKALEIIN